MGGGKMSFIIEDDVPAGRFVIEDAPSPKLDKTDRFLQGMRDPIDGGAQLLTNILPERVVSAGNRLNNWLADKTGAVARIPEGGLNQAISERSRQYEADRAGPDGAGFDWPRLAGNVLNPVSLAMGVGAPAAATMAGRMAVGAGVGAVNSALSPVNEGDFATEKAKQLGAGAVLGGVAPLVAGGVARVISPKASVNPNVQLLRREGVTPTVGQALGGRWNALEEKAMSLPIVGDMIANARSRSLEQFNNAAVNRASGAIGMKTPGAGQQAIREAGDALSDAYDAALSKIQGVQFDPKFQADLTQLKSMAQNLVPGGMHGGPREKFMDAVKNIVVERMGPNGTMLPETFKKVDSEIGQLAAKYGKSSLASEQEVGDALKQLQNLLKQQMLRTNPQVAAELKRIDAGWANLVRLEGAAKAGKNTEGMFTPAQLNAAIQGADSSVRKRSVARGTALMQDLGNAGQQVLGNKVPNSFTTDRALIAGGGLGAYFLDPTIPASLMTAGAMYTKPMQGLLSGAVTARPQSAQAVAHALRQASPGFGLLGGPVGFGLLNAQNQ
jgi:hypothetical protein